MEVQSPIWEGRKVQSSGKGLSSKANTGNKVFATEARRLFCHPPCGQWARSNQLRRHCQLVWHNDWNSQPPVLREINSCLQITQSVVFSYSSLNGLCHYCWQNGGKFHRFKQGFGGKRSNQKIQSKDCVYVCVCAGSEALRNLIKRMVKSKALSKCEHRGENQ